MAGARKPSDGHETEHLVAAVRELAEMHNLTRFFWYKEPLVTWRRRETPKLEVENEIARRHNPAVKAALESLLSASAPTGPTSTRRPRRSRRTAVSGRR